MDYDLVIVGGGLAGASLGIALAQHGAHVLILEKDPAFRE
jgi:flavin-dependent dehydrogenase